MAHQYGERHHRSGRGEHVAHGQVSPSSVRDQFGELRPAAELYEHDADEQRHQRSGGVEFAVGQETDDGACEQRSRHAEHGHAQKQDVGNAFGAAEPAAFFVGLVQQNRHHRVLDGLSADGGERLILLGMNVEAEFIESGISRQQRSFDGLARLQGQKRNRAPAAEIQCIFESAPVDPRLKIARQHGQRADQRHDAAGGMPDEQGRPLQLEHKQRREGHTDRRDALEHRDQRIIAGRTAQLRNRRDQRMHARTDTFDGDQHDHRHGNSGGDAPGIVQEYEGRHEGDSQHEARGQDQRRHRRHQAASPLSRRAAETLRQEIAASHLRQAHRQRGKRDDEAEGGEIGRPEHQGRERQSHERQDELQGAGKKEQQESPPDLVRRHGRSVVGGLSQLLNVSSSQRNGGILAL